MSGSLEHGAQPDTVVQRAYCCKHCGVQCRRPQDLRRHLLVHTDASFSCERCGHKFTRYDTLTRHKRDNCHGTNSDHQRSNSHVHHAAAPDGAAVASESLPGSKSPDAFQAANAAIQHQIKATAEMSVETSPTSRVPSQVHNNGPVPAPAPVHAPFTLHHQPQQPGATILPPLPQAAGMAAMPQLSPLQAQPGGLTASMLSFSPPSQQQIHHPHHQAVGLPQQPQPQQPLHQHPQHQQQHQQHPQQQHSQPQQPQQPQQLPHQQQHQQHDQQSSAAQPLPAPVPEVPPVQIPSVPSGVQVAPQASAQQVDQPVPRMPSVPQVHVSPPQVSPVPLAAAQLVPPPHMTSGATAYLPQVVPLTSSSANSKPSSADHPIIDKGRGPKPEPWRNNQPMEPNPIALPPLFQPLRMLRHHSDADLEVQRQRVDGKLALQIGDLEDALHKIHSVVGSLDSRMGQIESRLSHLETNLVSSASAPHKVDGSAAAAPPSPSTM